MADLDPIVVTLLSRSVEKGGSVTLDDVVDAIGNRSVSYDDVSAIFTRLEKRGVKVDAPRGGRSEKLLGQALAAARTLRARDAEAGGPPRVPTYAQIAEEARLSVSDVELAMAFARVVQR